jgi:hypothetical protein
MSTVIVAVILILFIAAIVLALIGISNRDRKKTTLALLGEFSGKAMESNLSFSSQEILDDALIGLDGVQRKLLVIKRNGVDKYDTQLIDLKKVRKCTRRKIYQGIKVEDGKKTRLDHEIEKIVLEFEYFDGRSPTQIIFFEPIYHHMLAIAELDEKAKKWEGILSQLLSTEQRKTA